MLKPSMKEYNKHLMMIDNDFIRFKLEQTTLEIHDPDGTILAFIHLLDGTHSLADIARMLNLAMDEVEEAVALLDRHRLITCDRHIPDSLSEREMIRYKNNFTYFSMHESLHESKYDYQLKLKNATVAVVGIGGGSVIVTWLAAMGVGKIIIVDYDTVELNNLNRQFFYSEHDIGDNKTSALARRIHSLNSDVQIEMHHRKIDSAESLLDIIPGADLVVCAIDQPPLLGSRYVNSACLHLRIPSYYVGIGNTVGFFYRVFPYQSSCIDCRLLHILRTEPDLLAYTKRVLAGGLSNVDFGNPGFAPNVAFITSLIASEIAKQLTGYMPAAELPFTMVNFRNMEVAYRDIPKSPDCPSCGKQANKLSIEPISLERMLDIVETMQPHI